MVEDVPYAWFLLVGVLRVGVVAAVSFVVLTRFALPGTTARSSWEGRGWGDAVLGVSVTVVVATALGLLGLFDTASLAAALALGLAGGAVLRYRRLWRRTLLQRYAALLEWIEWLSPPDPVAPGVGDSPPPAGSLRASAVSWSRARWRAVAEMSPQAGWWVGVGVLAAVALGVRLIPALAEAAPFTLRYYASLETLKGLVEGRPVGSPGGWGLHALVMALSEMARVDAALVLRGVGAVAGAAIAYGVYQTARFYWCSRPAAFAGALFVAAGGPLLPLPLERQAGAEPLMLAAALALPVFPHVSAYLGDGSRRGITVAAMGLLATGLVAPSVGVLLVAIVAVYVGTILHQIRRRRGRPEAGQTSRYRNRGLRRRVSVMAAAGAGAVAVWWGYVGLLEGVSAAASIFFYEAAQSDAWFGPPVVVAGLLGALTVGLPFVPGRAPYESRLPRSGALLRTGGQTLAMLAVWVWTGAGYDGLSGAAVVLLMTGVGVDLALVVNEAWVRWAPRWRGPVAGERAVVWAPASVALAVGLVVIGTGWSVPVPGPGVEPDGFVKGYHAIDRDFQPYAWTAVSHLGTGVLTKHRGRFMDYEYFLLSYDPDRYDHAGAGAIPTPDLFVFLERGPSQVGEELLPSGRDHQGRLHEWVRRYARRGDQAARVSVFYRDEDVEVIRISRPVPEAPALARGGAPTPAS